MLKINRNEQAMHRKPLNSNENDQRTCDTEPPSTPNGNSNAAVEGRSSSDGSHLRLSSSTRSASSVPTLRALAAPSTGIAVLDEAPLDAPLYGITGVPVPGLPFAHGSGSGGFQTVHKPHGGRTPLQPGP